VSTKLPPLYFRTLCIAGGVLIIGLWAVVTRVPMRVPVGGEQPSWHDYAALSLIEVALSTVFLAPMSSGVE